MVAENVLLTKREEACLSPRRQVTDPQLKSYCAGSSAPAVLRAAAIPRQFFEEWLKNIQHGVSVRHETKTVIDSAQAFGMAAQDVAIDQPDRESVLAGPAPRAEYHMRMREGAAPAVAGDAVTVRRAAVCSDEEGGVREARESLKNVQRTY